MHGRQLVTRLGMAASPGSRGPVTAARAAASTTPTGSPAPRAGRDLKGGSGPPGRGSRIALTRSRDRRIHPALGEARVMPPPSGSETVSTSAPIGGVQGLGHVSRRECHARSAGRQGPGVPTLTEGNAMADRTLVLAIFEDEAAADNAAAALKDSGLTSTDAMGVLAVDATGKLKEEKVGARSTGKGAGVGAALFLLGPAALGVGVLGGAAAGALHHKGLKLTDADRERIGKELTNGKAAVGVLTPFNESSMISEQLSELGGASEEHTVSDEALQAGQ